MRNHITALSAYAAISTALARRATPPLLALALAFALAPLAAAQHTRGELHIEVHDPQGAALSSDVELVSDGNDFRLDLDVGSDGRYIAQNLPFGVYRVTVDSPGFGPWSGLITVASEVPVSIAVTLGLSPVATHVNVSDAATLVDPSRTGTTYSVGRQTLGEAISVQPARGLSDQVDDLPGWLYEANGILHPRGSEYDVQYVIDGLPITENRSPAFAPLLDADAVESLRVLTANYPAEYGRKLGGVIEVDTQKNAPAGWHGEINLGGGSFGTGDGSAELSYSRGKDRLSLGGNGLYTGRYLDPPVLANYTNSATSNGFFASYERDFSDLTRLRVTVSHNAVRYLVPNELVQQQAGQKQDVANIETGGEIYFQRVVSPDLVLSAAGSVRDSSATLSSNPFSTPVIVSQGRGYREGYGRADLAGHRSHHEWKVGVDTIANPVHESLQYTITDPTQFDEGTPTQFQFSDRRWDVEPSAYAQDQIRFGNWNASAGLRFDHYAFVVHQSGWSPRLGVSRYISSLNLLLHASYDRVFQTPALENLLLASSPEVDSLNPIVLRLPVLPARANFYEIGVTKSFRGSLRIDANVFRRNFRNYSDDDVLLDTGVSFPIAFDDARITGEELRVEVPHWGRFSGYLSYANQIGIGQGPITGGFFLGSDGVNGLADTSRFPVSQDQRNTARARVRVQANNRLWLAASAEYGSGLPAETDGADPAFLLAQYGRAILNEVNLNGGRVKRNVSLDGAAGMEFYRKERRGIAVQFEAMNLTNRVNVINFASLFSGTAVAPPRSAAALFRFSF